MSADSGTSRRCRAGPGLALAGMTPFSTIDFPARLAAVLHCQGCPLACRYCHSDHLQPVAPGRLPWPAAIARLEQRRGLLDAVVISGGEPCAQSVLPTAITELRRLGFEIGLHTAGLHPDRLGRLLGGLVDWVGFDLKSSTATALAVTGRRLRQDRILHSLDLLMASGVPYEIRTTWHPELLPPAAMLDLAVLLERRRITEWIIQPFWPGGTAPPALAATMRSMPNALLRSLARHVPGTRLRPS